MCWVGATGQYVPKLVLKGFKGGNKKLMINCFPVEDIVQEHYTAQLLATFCRTDAFDYKGSQLSIISTFIPNRFRINKGDTLKSVSRAMKKAKANQKKPAAQKTAT